jgi:uncharacterized membrane protein YfcA
VAIELVFLLLALVVVVAYSVQMATGFGAMLVSVTVGAHLMPLDEVIHLILPLSLMQTTYVAVKHRDAIERGLLRRALPWMAAGVTVGLGISRLVRGPGVGLAFGVIILVLATLELVRLRSAAAPPRPLPPAGWVASLLGAGVIHGIYASSGPLLVYAIGRQGVSKRAFRSTVSALWIAVNAVMVTTFLLAGDYDAADGLHLLWLAPAVPVGMWIGDWVHNAVDEHKFKIGLMLLLVAAALSLIVRYAAELA